MPASGKPPNNRLQRTALRAAAELRRSAEEGTLLEHAASEQYGKVAPGDILWFVTYQDGTLYLVGRMEVACIVGQHDVERILLIQAEC